MKSHLKEVPVYAPVGRIASAAADDAVAAGHAHSLRGRALLLKSPAYWTEILAKTELDAETVALILRAVARLNADEQAARTDAEGASGVR